MKRRQLFYTILILFSFALTQISFAQTTVKCIGLASDPDKSCITEIEFNRHIYFELSDLTTDYQKPENIILYINDFPLPYYVSSGVNQKQKRVFFKLGLKGSDANNSQKSIVDLIRKDFQNYNNNIPLRFGLGNKNGDAINYDSKISFRFFNALSANIIAVLAVILFIVIFYALIKSGLLDESKTDKTKSLRKFQFAFWLFLIILSYISLWLVLKEAPVLPSTVIGVLSISLATTIVSSYIPEKKAKNNTNAGLRGLFVDSGNEITITRVQYIIFTLLFGMIFIYTTFFELSIYDFSTQQLALMGVSSGGYLGLKTYYANVK